MILKTVECSYLVKGKRSPVKEFICSLDFWTRRKFLDKKDLLEEFGHKLPGPHAKYLKDGIFELRFSGKEGKIRVLYFFFHKNKAIFTNGFIKKTQKTPKQQLKLAIKDRNGFLEKYKKET
ncbi:MAG: type II toxin-antitoxin system RelE/ParE family toxin [Candidatus Omnitrophica bacterium]|nr:type II toxin-antitoxin system RelE/ParE family toxin [Candidatus Omnitrophota bacterium]